MIRIKSFQEDVTPGGRFAICYHRTNTKDLISIIKDKGFKVSAEHGAMYGKGWYFTYELDSQMNNHMKGFGEYIVKARVPLNGFLIFDEDIAQEVYGEFYDIPDQIKKITRAKETNLDSLSFAKSKSIYKKNFDIPEEKDIALLQRAVKTANSFRGGSVLIQTVDNFRSFTMASFKLIKEKDTYSAKRDKDIYSVVIDSPEFTGPQYFEYRIIKEIYLSKGMVDADLSRFSIKGSEGGYSSDIALNFYEQNAKASWYKDIKGLMYTGRRDGNCVVVYDYKDVIPLSVLFPYAKSYYPKDNFMAFEKKIKEVFSSEEMEMIEDIMGKQDWIDFIEDMYDERAGKKSKVSQERQFELRNYLEGKLDINFDSILEIITTYRHYKYMKDLGKLDELESEYQYYPDFEYDEEERDETRDIKNNMNDFMYAINKFMGNNYILPTIKNDEWHKVDNETLKHFVKQGIKKE